MARTSEAEGAVAKRMWGRVAGLDRRVRIVALVFAAAAIVSMSFCQLGFWPIGVIDDATVHLMLLLAPLAMAAFIFGPFTGALMGLFAGAVVIAHAQFFPLDFHEVYFMTPLNTFVLLTLFGALAGWLFAVALRSRENKAACAGVIIGASVVLSLIASILMQVGTVLSYGGFGFFEVIREALLISPPGLVVQALVDAVLISVLCIAADAVIRLLFANGSGELRLLTVFRSWMFAISFIVFMVASGAIFSIATIQAEGSAEKAMRSEISYLEKQLSARDHADYDELLDGYEVPLDGYVVITDRRGTVLATDDAQRYPVGASFLAEIGYDWDGLEEGDVAAEDASTENAAQPAPEEPAVPFAETFFTDVIENEGGASAIQAVDEAGTMTMDIAFLTVGSYDDGYIAMVRSADMVFETRLAIMASATLLAVVLIIAIAIVASRLLNAVVVRRIDETNSTLSKITEGDLDERVHVRDSREFSSLSAGINTTVSALKDSIAEAEQKNAQELATAKAIQESSLPTEFPAFPDIDRFDIYASMKTAKEVGGDFYDFFLIEGTRNVGFVMADVSGKGIPAALFMMTAKTQLRTYLEGGLPVGEAIDAANHQLCLGNDAGMFVTLFACVLDYDAGKLSYVNAGHNPPLILHGGAWEWMRDVSGMPLGLFDGIPYEPFERQLVEGDMLYLYTDGVTEAMDAEGNLFGEERLEQTLVKYASFNPRSACVGVRRAITDFTLDCEQSDDITMLALKFGVPPETRAVMILNATDDQLVHVCNYIHAELHRRRAPKSVYNPLDIAAEELFVNVCHYAYPDATPEAPGDVRISFEYESNPPALTVQIVDDGIPYNPLAKPDAVTPDDIMDVPIGGLGILMAKNSVDEMTYERVGESNVLTFKKGW